MPRTLSGGRALTLSAQWNRLDYDGAPTRDADRYAVGIGYVTRTIAVGLSGGRANSTSSTNRHCCGPRPAATTVCSSPARSAASACRRGWSSCRHATTAGAAGADRPQLSGLVQGFFLAGADEAHPAHWAPFELFSR